MNVAYNMDCLEAMRKMPDNAFDLAVVDPPYGSGLTETGGCKGWFAKYHQDGPDNLGGGVEPIRATIRPIQTRTIDHLHSSCRKHERERAQGGAAALHLRGPEVIEELREPEGNGPRNIKKIISWDTAPKQEYFEELFRVSRNQIIWGGQLLRPSSDKALHHLQEDKHSRKRVQHGTR